MVVLCGTETACFGIRRPNYRLEHRQPERTKTLRLAIWNRSA
jgi:hypothetical protein